MEWMLVSSTTICHIPLLCHSFFATTAGIAWLPHHVQNIDSSTMWDIFVAVCKGCRAVVEDKSFIVKGIKTGLVYFDRPQDVVGGKKGSECAGSGL